MDKSQDQSWLDLLDASNSGDGSRLSIPEIIIENPDGDSSRELEIAFNDSENEKKFDKLMNAKKIKSPFKRHLSNEKLDSTNGNGTNLQDEKRSKMEGESPKKRMRTDSADTSSTNSGYEKREYENDRDILDRRQKQVDYGKNTIGYDNYISQVPKDKRTYEHPKTPPKQLKYSRRAWEGLVKSWRKKLHAFDPESAEYQTDDKN